MDSTDGINFFDPATNACPYPAYASLRDDAPVRQDPVTGFYMLTRYEDIRAALMDTRTFTNRLGNAAGSSEAAVAHDPEKARELLEAAEVDQRIAGLYEEKGWVPVPTLDAKDEPEHMELRRLFDHAFRPAKVKELDPFVEGLAYRLLDEFLADGRCEWVSQYAIPLPLYVIGVQVGVPRTGHAPDQGLDRRMGAAAGPCPERRRADLVGRARRRTTSSRSKTDCARSPTTRSSPSS